jgi:hypothetical protein
MQSTGRPDPVTEWQPSRTPPVVLQERHLQRYLAEFDFRYKNGVAVRVRPRAIKLVKGAQLKWLTYRTTGGRESI